MLAYRPLATRSRTRHVHRVVGLQLRRHVADPALPFGDRRSPRISRALDAAAQGGREIAVEELQETGLARAVRAEHRPVLALAQFPVEIAQHRDDNRRTDSRCRSRINGSRFAAAGAEPARAPSRARSGAAMLAGIARSIERARRVPAAGPRAAVPPRARSPRGCPAEHRPRDAPPPSTIEPRRAHRIEHPVDARAIVPHPARCRTRPARANPALGQSARASNASRFCP